MEVVADTHWPLTKQPESSVTVWFPVLGADGMQTLTLPVSFEGGNQPVLDQIPDLNNAPLIEVVSEDIDLPSHM